MANESGRYTVLRKLVRTRNLSAFLLLGSFALIAALVLTESRGPVSSPATPGSDSIGKATESREDSPVDTLKTRDVSGLDIFSPVRGGAASGSTVALSVETVLSKGLRELELSPVHLAFRGTASANAVRCEWRGVARTPAQRERAIRFWLGLEGNESLPSPVEVENRFLQILGAMDPAFPETTEANFRDLARGGLSTDYVFLSCFADFSVAEYFLGAGPSSLTVAYDNLGEARSYELYQREHQEGVFGDTQASTRGEYEESLREAVTSAEAFLAEAMGGHESVVFVAPMGAHNAIAVETWQAVDQWHIQTDDQGVVHAVRYGVPEGDPEQTQTLAKLKSRVTAASTTDDHAGKRIANASRLRQYYSDIGAYGDITPDDGSNATFIPAQPPTVYTCASGTAVANPATNRGLVHDCETLLAVKDALRGSAALNWSADSSITGWDGVITSVTPNRVTDLPLRSRSLSGSIPPELGTLFELVTLDLSNNSLTGEIPGELAWLHKLEEIKLSGNSLTGCIPVALKDVEKNDLSSLNLLYCRPPAPGAPTAGTVGETGVQLSWTAVANTSKYRVEYREATATEWTVDDETLTGTTHTVDGLTCGTEHRFRVRAYGSGVVYATEWSEPSAVVTATTTACTSPVFDAASYAFRIAEDAEVGAVVGNVSATDPNGDTLTYSVTGGNEDGKFAISGGTGAITVAAELDYETTTSYTLTVEADDGNGGTATVSVVITIADVAEATITITELSSSISQGKSDEFTVTVSDVNSSNVYIIQATTSNGNIGFAQSCATTSARPLAFSGRMTYSAGMTLYGCAPPGGKVTVTLHIGGFSAPVLASGEMDVAVTPPAPASPLAPTNLAATPANAEVALMWNAVPNVSKYRVEYRDADSTEWTVDDESITTTNHTVDGLACGTEHRFRVSAYGDGTAYAAEWGAQSEVVTAATTACVSPVFDAAPYAFRIAEDAKVGAVVGSVSATDPYGDTPTYSFTGGNEHGKFAIDGGTGVITVAAELDYETTSSYTLSAQAAVSSGRTGSASVEITVQDVLENTAPPAPEGLSVSVAQGRFTLTWNTVPGADRYEAQYRVVAAEGNWISLGTTGSATAALTLSSTPVCGTKYEFRVRAQGDGATHLSEWGLPSDAVSLAPDVCNNAPRFGASRYDFSVLENAGTDAIVGRVSASDPDAGDAVVYSITSGNDAGKFSIDAGTGVITVAGALDHQTSSSYTLTAQAADGRGGTATVVVAVSVTSASCSNGTVVPNPTDNPSLVADCSTLLAARDALEGTASLNWSPATAIGSWEGVTVGGTPKRVQRLRLVEKGLTGSVPAELGKLDALTHLNLSDNELSGGIPASLGSLSKLEDLNLEYNQLSGEIPTAFGTLTELRWLSLSANRLTGAIPPDLGKLTRLTSLDLAENRLSGNPPAELGNLRSLHYLSLGSNRLTGSVPAWVSGLRNLQNLYLDNNSLTGSIPTELGGLSNLSVLSLGRNGLTGTIPSALGSLSKLEELALSRNKLTGPIPDSLAGLDQLEYLYLSGNSLTGCVSAGLRAVANNDLDRLSLLTCPNRAPVFAETSYALSIAEDAAVGAAVGTVTASDPDGDSVTYSITAGNGDGKFAVGADTGAVTVAGTLDYETVASYTFTVTASDGKGGSATVTVKVAVTDVVETPPPKS